MDPGGAVPFKTGSKAQNPLTSVEKVAQQSHSTILSCKDG